MVTNTQILPTIMSDHNLINFEIDIISHIRNIAKNILNIPFSDINIYKDDWLKINEK